MAIVKRLPGNTGPVNQGEEVVLAHLEKALPNSFTLIPNITISFERDGAEEYDIIAVGPDGVIVVEVKTIFGSVEITEQTMIVDGDVRANPWKSSRIKAQKLASRLSQKLGDEPKTWVEHVVVFSKPPLKLDIFQGHKDKIFVGAQTLVPKMMPPSQLIHQRGHGLHANRTTQIVDAIMGGSSIRQVRRRFGEYLAIEKVNLSAINSQIENWNAEHRRHGGTRKLDVYLPSLGGENMGQQARRTAEQRVTVANQIGPSADIISSFECFETEAGEFVVVWPSVDSPPLAQYFMRLGVEKGADDKTPISDADARKLLEGFASAYSDLHQAGFVFGDLAANSFVVRPTGRGAIVLQNPIPTRSSDHRKDLEKLAEVANAIVALSAGGTIAEVVKRFNESLKSEVRAEWASAGWLAAACQVGVQSQVQEKKLGDLFEDLTVIATHTCGKTYTGINKETKKKSVIRVEKDRPGDNWVRRESDVLKRDELRSCLGAVQWLQSGQVDEGHFVETQWLNGVSMTSILDAKLLENQSDAVKATLQLLEVLNKIHPDLEKLDELVGLKDEERTNDQLQMIAEIRLKGVAHNHIEPNNVIWVEGRPVLVDFARAAEIGRIIPVRLSPYWPPNDDRAQSNATADLYAVGLLLLAMLTGPFNPQSSSEDDIESRLATIRKQKPALASIIEKAIEVKPENRFRSAKRFIDALVSLDLKEVKSPQVADVVGVIREVEELVAAGKFDQALAICTKREWYETAEQIKRKKNLVSAAGQDLVNVDGVRLTYLGTREVGPGTTGSNRPYQRGSAHVYLVRTKDGGVLEAHTVTAKPVDEKGKEFDFFETWVQGDLEYGLPEHLQMLADRRRLVVNALNKQGKFESNLVEQGKSANVGDLSYCQIRQLQLKDLDADNQPIGSRWEATNKKVNESQLRAGAAGADVFELLKRFGAVGVGTRQDVISDESRMKGDLCVKFKFDASAIHIPIIVFLIARFLPLKNKVVAQ
jgi:serine/threonine protein kinase